MSYRSDLFSYRDALDIHNSYQPWLHPLLMKLEFGIIHVTCLNFLNIILKKVSFKLIV